MLPVTTVPLLLAVVERVLAGQASVGEHTAQQALDTAVDAMADRLARLADRALGGEERDEQPVIPTSPMSMVIAPGAPDLPSCSALAQHLVRARQQLDGIPGGPEVGAVAEDLDALAARLAEYVQAAGSKGSRPLAVAALRRLTLTATRIAAGSTA